MKVYYIIKTRLNNVYHQQTILRNIVLTVYDIIYFH